ncbi:MAG: RNA-directed DNA polymerase [Alphaproteobacteria bacterium]|nr:RNA-directed DNA polymerase [Alphaproteobacteria bacterium]
MKRANHLFDYIINFDNLQYAYYKAKKGKEHKADIVLFSKNVTNNLKNIHNKLINNDFEYGNYHYFTIFDPKERIICAASFPERIVHHAIMNICHPYFENYQIEDSYATRLNKGHFKAIAKARIFHHKNNFFNKFDIKKYFDTIDHIILFQNLHNKFKDNWVLNQFYKIINSYHTLPQKGLPIGNLTSQYFANFYLTPLDRFIKQELKIKYYLRYMDDFVIWGKEKSILCQNAQKIQHFLELKSNVTLKTNYFNTTIHGCPFLGFVLFPNKILLNKRSRVRYFKKSKKLYDQVSTNHISQKEFQIKQIGLNAFVNHAYSKQFKQKVYEKINTGT